jgi:hypothetical protein
VYSFLEMRTLEMRTLEINDRIDTNKLVRNLRSF